MTAQVLTAYPLSQTYRLELEKRWGFVPDYLLLSQLRAQSTKLFLQSLRQMSGHLIVAIEDPQSHVLLPILVLICHVTRAKKISVMYPDFSLRTHSRIDFLKTALRFTLASMSSSFQCIKTRVEVNKLLSAQPLNEIASNASRILYVNANLWFGVKAGGSVGHVAGVVNGFSRQHCQVTYCAVEQNGLIDKNIKFIPINAPTIFGLPYETNYYRFNQLAYQQLASQLRDETFKFIYQRLSLASYLGVLLAQQFHIPLVLEYNGSEAWIAQHWGRGLRYAKLAMDVEALCLKHAKLVVTISDVLRDELIVKGVPADRIVTYPNGIDPTIFSPDLYSQHQRFELRQRYDLEPDALVCTFVGTFGRWHGVPILAQAIARWVNEDAHYLEQHKIRFLLIGDGASMPDVKKILSTPECQFFCRLPGLIPQQETPALLAASDILFSPHVKNEDGSRFFGSPTKLFEYMAMEKPIIASDLEQIGEVVKPALSVSHIKAQQAMDPAAVGILCEPGNEADIIEAIRFLVKNPSARETLGKNARQKVLSNYTWQHHVAAIQAKFS